MTRTKETSRGSKASEYIKSRARAAEDDRLGKRPSGLQTNVALVVSAVAGAMLYLAFRVVGLDTPIAGIVAAIGGGLVFLWGTS